MVDAGGGGPGRTHFICGFLGCDAQPFDQVLGALPSMIRVRRAARASDRMSHLIELALCELRERRQGGRGVLPRLSELMLIEVVRCVVESANGPQTSWLADRRVPANARPRVGRTGTTWSLSGRTAWVPKRERRSRRG